MQNIHVKRYGNIDCGYQGSIEPEDRAWIVFIDAKGEATFWRRDSLCEADDGSPQHHYVDVELLNPQMAMGEAVPPSGMPAGTEPMLDYSVRQLDEGEASGPDSEMRFAAKLNCREIEALGTDEHDAVKRLLNYVAQLCVAGCLDHTGQPGTINPRRYAHVWPRAEE